MTVGIVAEPIALPDGSVPTSEVLVVEARGDGREAGRGYGEACRPLIRQHLDTVLARLTARRGMDPDDAYRHALPYREATIAQYPELADEVDGVAEGAGLPIGAAWVLQLRAELMRPEERVVADECTSLGVVNRATADGGTLAGQNADLPAFYSDVLVLLRRDQPGRPRLATLTPAGQIGYHGMNEHGVSIFANFLHSDNWRVGVPRYFLTRVGLAERSREAALAAIERTNRASPRNVLIADEAGATNLETTTTTTARIEPENGVLAHSNHYIAPRMADREQSSEEQVANSRKRLDRILALLRQTRGTLDVQGIVRILRDRQGAPDALCRVLGEWEDNVITIASTIAEVRARRLWIAIGPPHAAAYHPYSV